MAKDKESAIIFLQVNRIEDILYKSSIPLSCKRLLNEDVEEFIVQEAENLPVRCDITLSINVSDQSVLNQDEVSAIIHNHFSCCKEKTKQQLANVLKLGWENLFIAFVFLALMFFATKALVSFLPEGGLMQVLRELIIILGWVALWRPADLLLYEWRPFKRKVKLFERISECNVQLPGTYVPEKGN